MTTKRQLIELHKKLKKFKQYKDTHRIEFVDWDKYPEQTDVINKVVNRVISKKGAKIYVIFGGNRSGKTEAGAACVTKVAETVKDSRILCATVETKISINVQQLKLKQWLTKDMIADGDYNPKRGWKNSIIEGTNGYNILFKTYAQGFEAFQGDNFDLIHLDEECPYDIFQECLMRTADRNGALLFTFTSLQGFTKLVNRLWESDDEEVYTTVLDLYMNPYIDKESKDLIAKTIDPDEVESRIHGKPHLKEGIIYKEYKPKNRIPDFVYPEKVKVAPHVLEIYDLIDPHPRTPHCWLRVMYDNSNDILYVVKELKAPIESMIISEYSKLIKASYDKVNPKLTLIDTSSQVPDVIHVPENEVQIKNNTILSEFRRNGINCRLVKKDNSVGIAEVKRRLREDKLLVFESCLGVHREFSMYAWDSYGSSTTQENKEMINRPKKKDDHYMDLIKYACLELLGRTKKPKGYVEPEADIINDRNFYSRQT